jgi:hypothetical protein
MKVVNLSDVKSETVQECEQHFNQGIEHIKETGPLKGYAMVGLHQNGDVSLSYHGNIDRFALLGAVALLEKKVHSFLLDDDDGD